MRGYRRVPVVELPDAQKVHLYWYVGITMDGIILSPFPHTLLLPSYSSSSLILSSFPHTLLLLLYSLLSPEPISFAVEILIFPGAQAAPLCTF
ncbi:hypothetical protein [Methanothrix sp.]|uniref:hypothetical protein n=1 Tax=Methanothrix sp. TaxID=90426 RepID=UPI001BD200C5